MSSSRRGRIVKYVSTAGIGLLAALYYAGSRNALALEAVEKYRVLCDAFTLPGTFMVMVGLLVIMNNLGALDTLAYAVHYLLHTFMPVAFGEGQSYLDFMEERRENRIKGGFGFLFITGAVFLAIGCVYLVLFYKALP